MHLRVHTHASVSAEPEFVNLCSFVVHWHSVLFVLFWQVLPDWTKSAPTGSASHSETIAKAAPFELKRLFEFMSSHDLEDENAKKRRRGDDNYRVPNQFYIQALEHSLKGGLGIDFQTFMPIRRVSALLESQTRYYVPHSSLAEQIPLPPNDPPDRMRSCIVDTNSGARWLEVPISCSDGIVSRPSLHCSADKGCIGMPGLCWLFFRQGLRGCLWFDLFHEDWNGLQRSCLEAGCWTPVVERCLAMNLPHGPWAGHAFHGSIAESGQRVLDTTSADNPIFMHLFDRICCESNDFPMDFASKRHMAKVWSTMRDCKVLRRLGKRIRLGRWYSIFNKASDEPDESSKYLFFLTYLGMAAKYWDSIDDSPVCTMAKSAQPGSLPEGPSASTIHIGKTTVKASNSEVDGLRRASRNSIELVCKASSKLPGV
jgi:hypothetical protein